jgi:hypothetical protein
LVGRNEVEREIRVPPAVQAAFKQGHLLGLDPEASAGERAAGPGPRQATTSLRSHWLHNLCKVCGHTFRVGDDVLVGDEVLHQMAELPCAGGPSRAGRAATSDVGTFFAGLAEAWPMPAEVPLVRLEGGHPLLAPTQGVFPRHACRICGHTFRPFDHVVLCPCAPDAPTCMVAVHRDILRQLHCWDDFHSSDLRQRCLAMS